jgi:hypothetical protein
MDEETENAFNSFGLLDEETKAQFAAEKIATRAMIDRLEAHYFDRGLKFTVPFSGSIPVQAFGHIDGLRFYFRFRGNWGSLKVGPYHREIEELWALRVNEDNDARAAEHEAQLNSFKDSQKDVDIWEMWKGTPSKVIEEYSHDFYPHIIVSAAGCEGHTPGDTYNGSLDNDEAYDIFIQLVDSLESIPEKDQLDEGTRIWLYEGRAARNAYDEVRRAQWQENNK